MARPSGSDATVTGPRVREAAQRLFARHGYAAVSMRMIAAEVGIGAGALYHYTPDKQTLLFEMMQAHLNGVLDGWSAVDTGPNALAQLEAFARFHVRYHLDRPDAVFIAYMELRSLDPENFARIEQLRRRYEAVPEAILKLGHQSGQMHVPDVKLTAMALIAMLTGVTTWYRDGGRLDRAAVEANYADMALGMVRAQGPSLKTA
ncbi:TetR/AcrR family transcriptional regulator [Jannaschia sp. 2305UL9-9]|uniref:TetR/AcrR family transcriptional regulator n=1 Tax=Jannaschia sp. 2305UL9-9 TaxID=3121638 RepID=UPI003528AC19